MNLHNDFIKGTWETVPGGVLMCQYGHCVWIPNTQSVLHTTLNVDFNGETHPERDPVRYGSFDLDNKALASLLAYDKRVKNVTNLAIFKGQVLIPCRNCVVVFNMNSATFTHLFDIVDYSLLCGVFHPIDGTMWFSAELENDKRNTVLCRVLPDRRTVVNVDLSLVRQRGLVRAQFCRWSWDGHTCYISCSVNFRVFAVTFNDNHKISAVRVFSFLPIENPLVGLDCDPFDNVVCATERVVIFWDRYGHHLQSIDCSDKIIDFAASSHEIILMHKQHWSRLKTEFHRRPVSNEHRKIARM